MEDSRTRLLTPRSAPPVFEQSEAPAAIALSKGGVRPRTAPRPQVAFITPNLLIGGVEHWLFGVLKHTADRIDWSVAVTNSAAIDAKMRNQVEAFALVEAGDGIRPLMGRADTIVIWGITDPARFIGGYNVPVVLVSHGCCDWTRHFVTSCRSMATHFAAVSEAATAPFGGGPVTVIPNGVDVDRCRAVQQRDEVRRAWGVRDREQAVGFVGRLSPEKNPLAVSQAVAALGAGFRAVYVGTGYGVDLRPAAMQLTPDAIFVPPMQQIGDALQALDCVIMASPSEGFSMALVEAMLAGVPVVATRVGVVPELERNHNVQLTTVGIQPSPLELAAAVRASISPERRPLLQQLQRIVSDQYTAEVMGRRWGDYLLAINGG